MEKMKNIKLPYKWSINIPSFKNPLLWFQLVVISVLPALFLLLLLVGLDLFEYRWQHIPDSIFTAIIIGGAFFLAFSLILLLMYGRGMPTKYVLKEKYIEQHTLSRGSKMTGILSLFGILSGKNAGYTAVGATLLAKSREVIAVSWKDINELKVFPDRKEIQLRNNWRTIIQIVCPDNQFNPILQLIKKKTTNIDSLKKSEIETITGKETPFVYKAMLTVLSLIFGLFLLPHLPVRIVGIFSIATIISAFLALWWTGTKKKVASVMLILIPVISIALSFGAGYVSMSHQGAAYALTIEILLIVFFLLLGLALLFKKIN